MEGTSCLNRGRCFSVLPRRVIRVLLFVTFLARIASTSNPNGAGYIVPVTHPELYHTFPREHFLTLGTDPQSTVASKESFHLKFRTRQLSNSTVIANGRTNEHYFNVEINEGRLVYRFADDNGLALSSYSLPSKRINDGEWHKLIIERMDTKFLISLDNEKYTEVRFNKALNENVFAGSRIMLGVNIEGGAVEQFEGDIAEVIVLIGDRALPIKEMPIDHKDAANFKLVEKTNQAGGVEKVIVRMDMTAGSSVSFTDSQHSEVVLRYPEQKDFDSFGISFKTSSDGIVASLLGDHVSSLIGLEVYMEQLIILIKDLHGKMVEHNLGRIEYNIEHTVHLRNDRQGDHGNVNAWLTRNREAAISVRVSNPFIIDRIVFGGEVNNPVFKSRKPIIGCIKKPYLNLFNINLEPIVPQSRSDCRTSRTLSSHVQAVAFGQRDRPLPFTYADNDKKKFQSLELEFSTLEPWGIIVSLHDSGDNFIALHLQNGTLHLTIDDKSIEQQSFALSKAHLNDGRYHSIKIMNVRNGRDFAQVDNSAIPTYFPSNIVEKFWITTIYFGAADYWAKDHYSLMNHGVNFVGCLRNIRFNEDTIIRHDHIKDKLRINSHCRPALRYEPPAVVYLKPTVSFSCQEPKDRIQVSLSNTEDFNSLSMPLSTITQNGVVASLSSNVDRKYIVLYLSNGRLQLEYKDHDTQEELQLVTDIHINDGQTHSIRLSRGPTGKLLMHVDEIEYSIALPQGPAPLFFDNLSLGGDDSHKSPGSFRGCFHGVEYNRGSVIPSNQVPSGRQECTIMDMNVCDAQTCDLRPSKFCSSGKCGLTCQPSESSLVKYKFGESHKQSPIIQKMTLAFRADPTSVGEMIKSIGPNAELSVNIENGGNCYLSLVGRPSMKSAGYEQRFDCPRKSVIDSKFHIVNLLKSGKQLNLSLDNENHALVYDLDNIPSPFDLVDREIVMCSRSYRGQLQDIVVERDGNEIAVLDEIISRSSDRSKVSVGPSAIWHDRYNQHSKREVDISEEQCDRLVCQPGARKCRSKRSTKKVCICVDANESECDSKGGVDPCASISCMYGTCIRRDNYAVCQCNSGYLGPNCNHRDPCLGAPCQNGGTCISQITGSAAPTFVCYCTTAFTGTYCETSYEHQPAPPVDPCHNVFCYNNGYCHAGQCICPESYSGTRCEIPAQIDPCAHVVCQNGGQCHLGRCACPSYFAGTYCEHATQRDPCDGIICQNGGQCHNGRCACHAHFTGSYCEQTVQRDPCFGVICQNGGQCHNGRCACPAHFTGSYCEQAIQADPCANVLCQNGGQCQNGRCACPAYYSGTYCEIRDNCYGVICNNGGQCRDGYCICPPGYSGPYCDQYDNGGCRKVICRNGGVCDNSVCVCPAGFKGQYCEIHDPCFQVHCQNNGQCSGGQCTCPQGFHGSFCENWATSPDLKSDSGPCVDVHCLNGGRCELGHCLCAAGFKGPKCEERLLDECAGACHNGAACVSGQCVCPPKFKGKHCDIPDPCFGVICKNGGSCDENAVIANSLKLCACPIGYYGRYCEIRSDPCYNVNCNNGQCIDGACHCSQGYVGEFCDQVADLCAGVQCFNGGSCYEGGCVCISHFFGDHCELIATTAIPQTYQLGLKGGLIEYGRMPRRRGKWLGGVLAIASGLGLGALALIYGVRQCAEGGCGTGKSTRIPINTGTAIPVTTGAPCDPVAAVMNQTVPGVFEESGMEHHSSSMMAEDRQRLLPVESMGNMGRSARGAGMTTEKIETIHERFIEGDLIDTGMSYSAGGAVAAPMYHVPPIADFGYDGIRTDSGNVQYTTDGAEAWDSVTTGGAGFATLGQGVSSLEMMSPGGLGYHPRSPLEPDDYELSNTMALTLTPNGKYAIVGQSQGPPQIWDAQTGNLINSMYGTCNNCTQLALACNGTLLVGLASDIADTQPCIVQLWDVSNGRTIHLSHQIKCSAFTLSNNMNNLVMAGNQKYGRGISVGILDLVSNELTKELKSDSHMPFGRDPSFIALTPDERHAIVGCYNQTQSLTNFVVFDLTVDTETVQPPHISLDCDPKSCVVLSNQECIAAVNNGQLFVWDINTCKPVHYFSDSNLDKVAHRSRINDIQLSTPNKSMLITASNDGTAKVWDTVNRTLMTRLLGHSGEVTCACFSHRSPDNQQLVVTGAKDNTICLWRLPSGQLAAQINIGMVPIKALMAAHNRTVVAIGEKENERQLLMLRVMQQTHHPN